MSNFKMFTAMITPYDQDLKVNYDKAAEIAKYLIDHDSDGLVVSGTTGESPVLSMAEKIQLFTTVKQTVGSGVEVWGGTGTYSTQSSIELSQQAEKAGVDGVLLVNPYYNKPSQEGMYQHFKAIAESLSIPVMLYNIPGRTGINLLPQTVARLAEIENIVAIKEASGSMDQVSELRNLLGDKIDIYAGDDSLTLPMLALGGKGVVSIASHLVGKDIKQMLNAFADGNYELAARIHSYLFPMFKGLFIATNPVPVKEALNIRGMQVGGFRLPLCSPSEEEIGFIQNLLKKYNL
ncbi:4-hydroxy-tetrahydrodipicolinate synthase, DapA [Syntrophomonas zehnderi OL-4]|uniref:4-hydroxy-tetrahydrodipicolinate synthase n=1 Tax=Syntrophomonas zehnderi OL-4 TaxID=690567 RepID=A0A0E4GBN2_9FIRM|nr:4-hydroxy-tetrahydrodipicolinate synthase [Syntrophomonas zehnderi]CFX75811.1 4-hydroxy-tetrahydrodipicolinate synthase, DapA [Syntrophomonas zehnderi OL-4]